MESGVVEKGAGLAMKQAAVAAVAGWTFGQAMAGRGLVGPLRFYDPVPVRMAVSPVLDAWIVLARGVRLGQPVHLVGASYLDSWRYPSGAAGFGLANLERRVPPPLSGVLDNPRAEDAGALGRACFWGLAHWGDPNAAALSAFFDASWDHAQDGVWCAVASAWVVSQMSEGADLPALVSSLEKLLPAESGLMPHLGTIRNWLGKPDGSVHGMNAVRDGAPAVRSLAGALLACGASDFGQAVGAAATSDCDRATCGLVAGVMASLRFGGIPKEWSEPLGDAYIAGSGLRGTDPPQAIEDFAEMVAGTFDTLHPAPVEAAPQTPVVAQTDATQSESNEEPVAAEAGPAPVAEPSTAPAPAIPEPPKVAEELLHRMRTRGLVCTARLEAIDFEVTYIDGAATVPGEPLKLDLRFTASGTEEVIVETAVLPPAGWSLATRATEFRAQPGRTTSFPAVVQSPTTWDRTTEHLVVRVNETDVPLPLLAKAGWAWVGPMMNAEGSGFDQMFLPEKGQDRGQTFANRSNMSTRWLPFDGDLERCFGSAPGVVYLAADLTFGGPGRFELVCGVRGGVKVWVDGKLVISASDARGVDLDNPGPFQSELVTAGTSRVLIKLVRGRIATGVLTFVTTRDDGMVVFPVVQDVLT